MVRLAKRYQATYLFLGHGSKSQYESLESMKAAVQPVVEHLDRRHGKGGWLAVFGGDSANANKPDVGALMQHLHHDHGVPLLAVQSDIVEREWGGVDKHVDFVRYVKTDRDRSVDPAKPTVLWGGFKDGKPKGGTKAYLSTQFLSKALSGVIAVGGGPIALQEAQYAHANGVPVTYVPAKTRLPEVNGPFGSLHTWAAGLPPTSLASE